MTVAFLYVGLLAGVLTWLPAYFQKGLGVPAVQAGQKYALVVALTIPLVMVASALSQRWLGAGWSSRAARARFSSVALLLAGGLFMLMVVPGIPVGMRVAIFGLALGFTPVIYALGPAMLAQVSPPHRRGAVLAIDNSVAALAGVIAPAAAGMLIERNPGAHGYELGFFISGVLLVIGAVIGWLVVNPERTLQQFSKRTS